MADPGKIPLRDFLARHPEFPSRLVKGWVYKARQTGLVALRIVAVSKSARREGGFMVAELALGDWLRAHPKPPTLPKRTAEGLSLRALDDCRPPELLPVVTAPVPPTGRCLSPWEVDELVDWGIFAKSHWRITPTAEPGIFALWRHPRPGSKTGKSALLPHRLTFPPGTLGAGAWASSDDERN